jgi:hypothetical protein
MLQEKVMGSRIEDPSPHEAGHMPRAVCQPGSAGMSALEAALSPWHAALSGGQADESVGNSAGNSSAAVQARGSSSCSSWRSAAEAVVG